MGSVSEQRPIILDFGWRELHGGISILAPMALCFLIACFGVTLLHCLLQDRRFAYRPRYCDALAFQ